MRYPIIALTMLAVVQLAAQTNSEKYLREQLGSKEYASGELRESFIRHDYSGIWTQTENSQVFGFIGENYQRIRIRFISVIRNAEHPEEYFVYGKTMVRNTICEFQGKMRIINIRRYTTTRYGLDDEYRDSSIQGRYSLFAEYSFLEQPQQQHSGIFRGIVQTDFYLDRNSRVRYDDIELDCADGFCNNQFVGFWSSYDGKLTKTCNWGDYRIPYSGDLDAGAGEFYVDEKYRRYGWENHLKAMASDQNTPEAQKALRIEQQAWWK